MAICGIDDLAAGGDTEKSIDSRRRIVIDRNMANGEGHLLAMIVLKKMGRSEEAKKHRKRSLTRSENRSWSRAMGLSAAESVVYRCSQRDGLFHFTDALGAQIEGQELVLINGHAYDKLTVLDRQRKRRVDVVQYRYQLSC